MSAKLMRSWGRRISPEGWAYGVLSLMFELSASSLHASWWMVDSCMARIGEQGMLLSAVNNQLRAGAGKGNPWWMVDSCMARIGEQGMLL